MVIARYHAHVIANELTHFAGELKQCSLTQAEIAGIATRYGLNGPGFEYGWRRDFPHQSRPVLGPTHPPVRGTMGAGSLSLGLSGQGVALTTNFHLVPKLKEE